MSDLKEYKPILLEVRKKYHMTEEGKKHWNSSLRSHIAKSPFTWRKYVGSNDYFIKFFPEGRIPVQHLSSEEAISKFIFNYLIVTDGDILALRGWQFMKTRTGRGYTKHLCEIKILSVTNRQAQVTNTRRLSGYGFWRDAQKQSKENRMMNY
jgi:hypothetical protein